MKTYIDLFMIQLAVSEESFSNFQEERDKRKAEKNAKKDM